MEINKEPVIGIEILEETEYFRPNGCENCYNGLANNVNDVLVYTKKTGWEDHYIIPLCHSCLCAYYNGDPLDDDCKDHLKI
jgi:hypothetical protein